MPDTSFPSSASIPTELRGLKLWCGYKLAWDESKQKFRKPPHSPVTGEAIGAVDKWADHWLTFEEAIEGIKRHGLDGPGFVFKKNEGYVGIDFDSAVKDGAIHGTVQNWLRWF